MFFTHLFNLIVCFIKPKTIGEFFFSLIIIFNLFHFIKGIINQLILISKFSFARSWFMLKSSLEATFLPA
jgi:hypothetical protein